MGDLLTPSHPTINTAKTSRMTFLILSFTLHRATVSAKAYRFGHVVCYDPHKGQSAFATGAGMSGTIWNIPNILTLARIALIPVFLLIAYWPPAIGIYGHEGSLFRHGLLTGLFILAALTDWLDGYLARALNQTSAFGRFLDPVADKLMVAAALVVLVQWHPNISMAFAAIVIISREITISALREWMAELGQRTSVAVSSIGKLKTTFQMVAISVFLLNWQAIEPLAYGLLYAAVVLTLWSMIIYLKAAWPYLKQP